MWSAKILVDDLVIDTSGIGKKYDKQVKQIALNRVKEILKPKNEIDSSCIANINKLFYEGKLENVKLIEN